MGEVESTGGVECGAGAGGTTGWEKLNLVSIESRSDWPSVIISMFGMSSESGMLITLLVVESASSPRYLGTGAAVGCGGTWGGGEPVSMGSSMCSSGRGEGDLVWGTLDTLGTLLSSMAWPGWGEVQVEVGRSGSGTGRASSTELELEFVAVVSLYCTLPGTRAGVSFTWQVCMAAAALAATTLW